MQELVGALVLHYDGNPIYTPERGTGGEAGTLVVHITQVNDAPSLDVVPQVRKSMDTTFTDLTGLAGITTVGTHTLDLPAGNFGSQGWTIRLKFTFGAGANPLDSVRLTYQLVFRPY